MPYVSTDYKLNADAKVGTWVCDPKSGLGPYAADSPPDEKDRKHPSYCGQCVSYVKQVIDTLPATPAWIKGDKVQDNLAIEPGTVIATFTDKNAYSGHAAIYESQNSSGIQVYDQWITGTKPKTIGPRTIKWKGVGISNHGEGFYVVEPPNKAKISGR